MINHPAEPLEQIQTWMNQNHPDRMPFFRSPASDMTISRVEERLGIRIPADLKSLYKAHDGQPEGAPCLYLNQRWLPIDLAAVAWEDLCSRHNAYHSREQKNNSRIIDSLKPWSPSWLPVFGSARGDHYCISLKEENNINYGSVIWYLYDRPERIVISESIIELLYKVSTGLSSGRWKLHDTYDGLTD